MSDLILYNVSPKVEDLVKKIIPLGVRVKSCTTLEHVASWIDLLNVGIIVCSMDTNVEDQKYLGEKIWKEHPQNILILVSEKKIPPSGSTFATRLCGADLIHIEDNGVRLSQLISERVSLKDIGQERHRVLVVEDLDSPRDIISAYIESIGAHDVEQASSAKEAFTRLKNTSLPVITCIVTDMKMPEHDGNDLIRWVRKDPLLSGTPIIVLTAYGTSDCLVDSLDAGATGFLVKPPKRTDIQRELSRAARIWKRKIDPRLIDPNELELFKKAIEEKHL